MTTTDRLTAATARLAKARSMEDMVTRPQWAAARAAARTELANAWREFVVARAAYRQARKAGAK